MSRFNEGGTPSGGEGSSFDLSETGQTPPNDRPKITSYTNPLDTPREIRGMSFSREIREKALHRIEEGVAFFGSPPLLVEASNAITRELTDPKILVTSADLGSGDVSEQFYTVPSDNKKMRIHVAAREDEIDTIICHGYERSEDGTLRETKVSFLGLGADKSRGLKPYYLASQINDYPLGVYVDFSWRDPSDEIRARLRGHLNSPQDRATWRVDGYGDREIFPWRRDRSVEDWFSLIVDNALLGPMERTLQPEFYSHDLHACMSRIASERD